jgi:opacity protein-like surface antigen
MRRLSMHRHNFAVLAVCLFACFWLSGAHAPDAFAQAINPRLSVFGGASLAGGERTFVIDTNLFQTEHHNGIRMGARGTLDLDWHWAAEVSYAFSTNDLQVRDTSLAQNRVFDVRAHNFIANVLYFFTTQDSRVRPFGTLGLGLSRFSVTGDSKTLAAQQFLTQPAIIRDENKFALNFGAGIEVKPWDRFGVRLDVRDHMSGMPRFGLSEQQPSPGASFYPVSGVMHRFELSGGIVIFLNQ